MLDDVDLLIAGAGPVGCVVAERAANVLGWKVLLVDKRSHLAGNCYDAAHANGVLIHRYGPHYFRTNDSALLGYLSRFTEWVPANYEVKSFTRGQLFPFPINLNTLEQFYNCRLDAIAAKRLIAERRQPVLSPANSEEYLLDRVGKNLYEAFYLHYTLKQWGVHPRELEAHVCGRIPVRLNRDHRYVDERYQVMPKRGFTAMFARMVSHPRVRFLLDCSFEEVRHLARPRYAAVYTGPIDEYFDCRLGKLPYRSLSFEFVPYPVAYQQPCVQINYPNDFDYTRSVEIKHVTGQKHPETVISYERPSGTGAPFYPVPMAPNRTLYERYKQLADEETRRHKVFFCGRLAQYRYFNTDEVILEALKCFAAIRKSCVPGLVPSAWSAPASKGSEATETSALITA
jgi:UDP-galactopyranose mutase